MCSHSMYGNLSLRSLTKIYSMHFLHLFCGTDLILEAWLNQITCLVLVSVLKANDFEKIWEIFNCQQPMVEQVTWVMCHFE